MVPSFPAGQQSQAYTVLCVQWSSQSLQISIQIRISCKMWKFMLVDVLHLFGLILNYFIEKNRQEVKLLYVQSRDRKAKSCNRNKTWFYKVLTLMHATLFRRLKIAFLFSLSWSVNPNEI